MNAEMKQPCTCDICQPDSFLRHITSDEDDFVPTPKATEHGTKEAAPKRTAPVIVRFREPVTD